MVKNGNVMMENKDIVIIFREPVVGENRWGGYMPNSLLNRDPEKG
jgi:hypothetical protein